jgi:hypothetical protein
LIFGGYEDGTRNFVVAVRRADTDNPSVVVVLRPLTASASEIRLRRGAAEPVFFGPGFV